VKIGSIRPVAEPRTPDKAARKAPAGTQHFSKSLERAVTELNQVSQQSGVAATRGDASSIQAEYSAAKEQFDTLMRVEQELRQLHRNITQKPTQDEG
jgi:hypothetical protein